MSQLFACLALLLFKVMYGATNAHLLRISKQVRVVKYLVLLVIIKSRQQDEEEREQTQVSKHR